MNLSMNEISLAHTSLRNVSTRSSHVRRMKGRAILMLQHPTMTYSVLAIDQQLQVHMQLASSLTPTNLINMAFECRHLKS